MAEPSETTRFTPGPGGPSRAQPESAAEPEPDREELLAAIRALSAQVGGLHSEVQSLRAQNRAASLPAAGSEVPGWDRAPARRESSAWIRSLDGPVSRAPAVPRLLLEVVFLVAVAVGAVIAKLDALVIVGIMIVAWSLVALAEWFAARAAKEQAEIALRPLAGLGGVLADDPAWFRPPIERSVLEPVPAPAEDDEDTQDKLKPQPTV